MTPFQMHLEKWRACRRCSLFRTRKRVVLARGTVPCDVLFVGEAPGVSEDVIGQPFVGPAGHLLDRIISASGLREGSYCITNLVGCLPVDGGEKGEPSEDSIRACAPRLQEMLRMCRPKLVVCVGKLSWRWCPRVDGVKYIQITHPAAILRMDVSQKGLMVQRCVVTLADALAEI